MLVKQVVEPNTVEHVNYGYYSSSTEKQLAFVLRNSIQLWSVGKDGLDMIESHTHDDYAFANVIQIETAPERHALLCVTDDNQLKVVYWPTGQSLEVRTVRAVEVTDGLQMAYGHGVAAVVDRPGNAVLIPTILGPNKIIQQKRELQCPKFVLSMAIITHEGNLRLAILYQYGLDSAFVRFWRLDAPHTHGHYTEHYAEAQVGNDAQMLVPTSNGVLVVGNHRCGFLQCPMWEDCSTVDLFVSSEPHSTVYSVNSKKVGDLDSGDYLQLPGETIAQVEVVESRVLYAKGLLTMPEDADATDIHEWRRKEDGKEVYPVIWGNETKLYWHGKGSGPGISKFIAVDEDKFLIASRDKLTMLDMNMTSFQAIEVGAHDGLYTNDIIHLSGRHFLVIGVGQLSVIAIDLADEDAPVTTVLGTQSLGPIVDMAVPKMDGDMGFDRLVTMAAGPVGGVIYDLQVAKPVVERVVFPVDEVVEGCWYAGGKIFISTPTKTSVFNEQFGPVKNVPGFDLSKPTLDVMQWDSVLVQAKPDGISHSDGFIPLENVEKCVSYANTVLVAHERSNLSIYRLDGSLIAQKEFEHEIGCIAAPPASPSGARDLVAVALWEDSKVYLLDSVDLQLVSGLDLQFAPRSLAFIDAGLLLVGSSTGDFVMQELANGGRFQCQIGTKPVRLTKISQGSELPQTWLVISNSAFYVQVDKNGCRFVSRAFVNQTPEFCVAVGGSWLLVGTHNGVELVQHGDEPEVVQTKMVDIKDMRPIAVEPLASPALAVLSIIECDSNSMINGYQMSLHMPGSSSPCGQVDISPLTPLCMASICVDGTWLVIVGCQMRNSEGGIAGGLQMYVQEDRIGGMSLRKDCFMSLSSPPVCMASGFASKFCHTIALGTGSNELFMMPILQETEIGRSKYRFGSMGKLEQVLYGPLTSVGWESPDLLMVADSFGQVVRVEVELVDDKVWMMPRTPWSTKSSYGCVAAMHGVVALETDCLTMLCHLQSLVKAVQGGPLNDNTPGPGFDLYTLIHDVITKMVSPSFGNQAVIRRQGSEGGEVLVGTTSGAIYRVCI